MRRQPTPPALPERETALTMIERTRRPGRRVTLGCGQAVRCGQLFRRTADPGHHPACRDQRHAQQAGQGQEEPWSISAPPPPRRLHRQPADQKAHRGRVRMGQDHRRPGQARRERPRPRRRRLHLPDDHLQPRPNTQTHPSSGMNPPKTARSIHNGQTKQRFQPENSQSIMPDHAKSNGIASFSAAC